MKQHPLLLLLILILSVAPGCAGKRKPLDAFAHRQSKRVIEKSAYVQADFDFWAAVYEPTTEDLEAMRAAWVDHGQTFPESKPITEIEAELRKGAGRVVLVSLFATNYDLADLRDQSLSWAVHPVPVKITELPETDVVIRTLMPVHNQWARYFLLRYPPHIWNQSSSMVISNANSKVELKRWNVAP